MYIGGLPILKEGGDVMDLQGVLTELLIEFNMEAVNLGALWRILYHTYYHDLIILTNWAMGFL